MGELPSISVVDQYVEIIKAYNDYRSTKEGKMIDELLRHLNQLAVDFCEQHDVTCCTRECYKHSHYIGRVDFCSMI
jgi:hypothetical protein